MNRLANHRPRPAAGFPHKQTGFGAVHDHNPAGSKLLRRFYKRKIGLRGDADKAATWYADQAEKFPGMKFPLGDRRNKVAA